jgi:hypothetical protein
MAIATRSGVREFVAPSDLLLPADQQTVWLLRPLDVFAAAELADSYTTEEAKWAAKALQMAKLALVGWRNFKNEDGTDLIFKGFGGRATDDDLRQIPFSIVLELVAEVHRFEWLSRKIAGE